MRTAPARSTSAEPSRSPACGTALPLRETRATTRQRDRLDSLRVGPSSRDGQSLLREAMEHFLAAARESDPVAKAQHMLVANAQTGLHEQIRLQPYIAGSLNAPIENTLARIWDERGAKHDDSSRYGQRRRGGNRRGRSCSHQRHCS